MTTLLILAAVTVAVTAAVLALLWWRDWQIDHIGDAFTFEPDDLDAGEDCGWWVGPVWKAGGEKCVCIEPRGHRPPHRCSCGAWFEGCGHPPLDAGVFDGPEPMPHRRNGEP